MAEKNGEITYAGLAGELKKNVVRNFYVFWGEETYLIDKAISSIKRICLEKGCEEMDFIRGEWDHKSMNPERLYEKIATPPFLSEKRVVIFRNTGFFSGKISEDELQGYEEVFQRLPDFTVLLFIEDKVDKRKKKLLDKMKKYALFVQMEKQKVEDLCKWASVLLKRDHVRITVDAVNSLVDRTECDMRILENEVEKIRLFCRYLGKSEISFSEIDEICIPDLRGSVFQMTDAIGSKDVQKALSSVRRLLEMKEPVTRVRFMLARHVRQLICAQQWTRSADLATALKISPYIAQKLIRQASRFQKEELKYLYLLCAKSDYWVKTGQIEEDLVLDMILCTADSRIHGEEILQKDSVV